MRRLAATVACDARLQHRNGFYWAVGLVVAFWLLLATRLPALQWGLLLPVVVLNNLLITAYFFVGGLVLLEKAEGSLQARMVTPLRSAEYLASKVLTLSVLGLLENAVVVAAVARGVPRPHWLAAGTLLAGAMLCLFGFVVVSRYDSVNEYLMPSAAYTTLAMLPVVPYFGIAASPLWYVHPMQAPLLLLRASFAEVPAPLLAYSLAYGLLWTGLLGRMAARALDRLGRLAETEA
jgi:fluoroquinolone transport system permease protein